MSLYLVALFIHILGVVGLFFATGLGFIALLRLRAVSRVEQAREWSGLARPIGSAHGVSGVLILLSGLTMVIIQWGWQTAWINLSLLALIALSGWGSAFNGRRFTRILDAAAAAAPGLLPANLAQLIADPALLTSLFATGGAAFGIVALMVFKPDFVASLLILVIAGLLGAGVAQLIGRRNASAAGVSASTTQTPS